MSSLPITGLLDVNLDEQSVRSVEQRLEEIGEQTVGISGGGGRGGGRGGARGREQAMLRSLQTDANDIAEEQLEQLVLIWEAVDDLGDGGDLFKDGGGLLGFVDEAPAGEAAGAAALTGAAAALTGSAKALTGAAAAIGGAGAIDGVTSILDLFSSDATTVEVPEVLDPVQVNEPDWELAIESIDDLSVDEPTLDVNDPSPLAIDPEYTAPLDPDYIAPVDETPIPVDAPESIAVDVPNDRWRTDDTNQSPTGNEATESTDSFRPRVDFSAGSGGISVGVGDGQQGISFGAGGDAGGVALNIGADAGPQAGDQNSQPATQQPQRSTNDITVNAPIEISADTDQILREFDREISNLRRELQRELRELERQLTRP